MYVNMQYVLWYLKYGCYYRCLANQEIGLGKWKPRSIIKDYVAHQMPNLMQETEIALGSINKVFAAHWVDGRNVVCATKCNLVRLKLDHTCSNDILKTVELHFFGYMFKV